MLLEGRNDRIFCVMAIASRSSSAMKWTLPETEAFAWAEPISAMVQTWPVTALITSGPQMNMFAVLRVMIRKSMRAGEYAAPPAHGPAMTAICSYNFV